jgi:hypothetical protein
VLSVGFARLSQKRHTKYKGEEQEEEEAVISDQAHSALCALCVYAACSVAAAAAPVAVISANMYDHGRIRSLQIASRYAVVSV